MQKLKPHVFETNLQKFGDAKIFQHRVIMIRWGYSLEVPCRDTPSSTHTCISHVSMDKLGKYLSHSSYLQLRLPKNEEQVHKPFFQGQIMEEF